MHASQSRRAQREVEKLKKRRLRELITSLREIMKTQQGRRVMAWIIHEVCRRDAVVTLAGSTEGTMYRAAVRDVAVRITEALDLYCPQERETMEVEAIRREHARRADADHVRRVADADESGSDD